MIGSSVPSAVVVSASPTYTSVWMTPAAWSANPAATPSATEISHPVVASSSGLPRTRWRSSSKPARKISAESPRSDSRLIGSRDLHQPEHARTHDDPEDDLEDQRRQHQLGGEAGEERREERDHQDHEQRPRGRIHGWRRYRRDRGAGNGRSRSSGRGDGDVGGLHRRPHRRARDEPEVGERGRGDLGRERNGAADPHVDAVAEGSMLSTGPVHTLRALPLGVVACSVTECGCTTASTGPDPRGRGDERTAAVELDAVVRGRCRAAG